MAVWQMIQNISLQWNKNGCVSKKTIVVRSIAYFSVTHLCNAMLYKTVSRQTLLVGHRPRWLAVGYHSLWLTGCRGIPSRRLPRRRSRDDMTSAPTVDLTSSCTARCSVQHVRQRALRSEIPPGGERDRVDLWLPRTESRRPQKLEVGTQPRNWSRNQCYINHYFMIGEVTTWY